MLPYIPTLDLRGSVCFFFLLPKRHYLPREINTYPERATGNTCSYSGRVGVGVGKHSYAIRSQIENMSCLDKCVACLLFPLLEDMFRISRKLLFVRCPYFSFNSCNNTRRFLLKNAYFFFKRLASPLREHKSVARLGEYN